LVIVELSDADGCGLGLIQDLRVHHPRIRILVLSSHLETCIGERALQAGAHGFVQKSKGLETILRAIHTVAEGGSYFSEELSARLAQKYLGVGNSAGADPLEGLSNRELQVFRLLGSGQSTRVIAASLGISIKTVETYVDHLKRKLGVESGVALTHRAVQWMERGILQ
jgi:DNA-binding NarL/FixJ family response regulator